MIAPPGFAAHSDFARREAARTARKTRAQQEAGLDRELVRRFNTAGDEEAFATIMARHRERVFSVAFGLLGNHADAEEIAQDAFIRAHAGLARFRGDSSLATWLHQIALNLARNRYWHLRRRRVHLTRSLDAALVAGETASISDRIASAAADPIRETVVNEFALLIESCMAQLGAPAREILVLRTGLNRPYREIAQELGIGLGTVKSRIARARESLRLLLIAACPEFATQAAPMEWLGPLRPVGGEGVPHA